MAIGSALGGWAAAIFGYKVAFVINAASFAVSAFSVWLIPEEATREQKGEKGRDEILESPAFVGALPKTEDETNNKRESFISGLKEGFRYTTKNHFALTILLMNIIWATGGGAINVVFDRMGGVIFAQKENWNPDLAVAFLWTASGFGLFIGMMIAHRVSTYLDRNNLNSPFIVWTLIVHGILFAIAGVMPSLWLFMFFCLISRAIVGVEYAVQETMFQRSLPDYIRGRISTLDRGAEMTVFGLSSYAASWSMLEISPQLLTVISGLLSASAGVLWFVRTRRGKALAYRQEEVLIDA
jgi:MFS family permease